VVAGATDQVTEQVAPEQAGLDRSLDRLTEVQWRIVDFADVPRSLAELMAHAGYSQRPHFVAAHMKPLLSGGVLRPTIPDKPRSSQQRYVLTDAGIQLKLLREQTADKPGDEHGH
jgi:ATP-dependent DNA helicase RecG